MFFEELGLPEPKHRLEVGGMGRDEMLAALRPGLLAAIEEERPDWVLVYGDTNSTLGGARAAVEAGVPLAHVEAGLRSYDDSMPEEHNRVETDRLSQLLFAPDDRSKAILEAENVAGRVEVVGDVMMDANQQLLPVAWERSTILDRLGLERGRVRRRDAPPGGERRGAPAGADPRGPVPDRRAGRLPGPPTDTAHSVRSEGLSLGHVQMVQPLGYLDFAALASRARVIVTDSGGLQKEAYWYGVPCVTARPSTEWVDTVEAGANVLVDDDPDRLADAVAPRGDAPTPPEALRRRARRRAHCGGAVPFPTGMSTYDIAVIGAGYVGMPHAQTFAEAGKKVVLVDVVQNVVDAINRGESHIKDVPSEQLKPLVDAGSITATTRLRRGRRRRRDRDRRADAAVAAARAGRLVHRERGPVDRAAPAARASSSCSSRRRTPARPARCSSRCSRRAAA